MKKITDFIVNKRYVILSIFIILAIISAILSKQVKINYDIAEYLPSTSETRIGMDIMEDSFESQEKSSFNLMFKGITNEEKESIKNYLENTENVSSVDYDQTDDYNKDDYTLYVINVEADKDSETSANVYNNIMEHFKDYETTTSGDISDRNNPVLQNWIIILAVGCALVILIIMSESYIEPFLFLFTILLGVLLNKGTNIIFGSVSNITQSISAILQLALSMDYSIMLMNRYNQEKAKTTDKIEAMKNALFNAFKSISSSSVTTIVGLLALVFMSFTIGKDLGLVLAKGVLFSLISIFFVLPALILLFDKWIIKTKKRSPKFNLKRLGQFSYKIRHISIIIFIALFIASYILKGNLGILYTDTEADKVASVFTQNNQIAIIYKNEDEEKVAKLLSELENNDKVTEILGYGNTINEKLTYNELCDKLNDLGADIDIEDYLLKILYYDYYNENEENTMTFNEFVNFIKTEVYNNDKVSDKIDADTKNNIDRLNNFTTTASINKQRSSSEIAELLEIDKNDIDNIFTYYNSKNNNLKLSISEFVNFINNDVLTDETYSNKVDSSSINSLNTLSKFTNNTTNNTKMTSSQMAKIFDMDETTADSLYKYYISKNDVNVKMTISEFSTFVLNDVVTNSQYASSLDETTIANIKMLNTFSNTEIINKQMSSQELSKLTGMDEGTIKQVLLLKYSKIDSGTTKVEDNVIKDESLEIDTSNWVATPNELVNLILSNSDLANVSEAQIAQLKLLSTIMNSSINNTEYSSNELATLIGIDESNIKNIYTLYKVNNTNIKLTPTEFINFILNNKNDNTLSSNLSQEQLKKLQTVNTVIDGISKGKKYTSAELSNLLGIDKDNIELIYGLYISKTSSAQTMDIKTFVTFVLNDVATNDEYSSNFDNEKIEKLNTVNGIINSTINNTKYSKSEIFTILSVFTDSIDEDTVDLLYLYYGSSNEFDSSWQMTIQDFVVFLNNDILNDERFDDFLDTEIKQKITDAKDTVNEAKTMLIGNGYSRIVLNTKFDPESEETFEFIKKIKDLFGENVDEVYVIGDSPMAYEMSQTFNDELNFITILTMIAIFVVVAITFKSVIIPIVLVLTIQCAVYLTMGILSFTGGTVYFIALLIVQSILMGATIDYAILYTSYYLESRKTMGIKDSIINSYNKSIHTILTSASILIIVTLIVGNFASAIAAKICSTISKGTLCSAIIILLLLPSVIALFDRFIVKKKK